MRFGKDFNVLILHLQFGRRPVEREGVARDIKAGQAEVPQGVGVLKVLVVGVFRRGAGAKKSFLFARRKIYCVTNDTSSLINRYKYSFQEQPSK